MTFSIPAGLKDWRTTLLGIAEAANGLYVAVEMLRAENAGMVFIDPVIWARFLLIRTVLKVITGVITPSSAKVKEKTEEMVEQKIAEAKSPRVVSVVTHGTGPGTAEKGQ